MEFLFLILTLLLLQSQDTLPVLQIGEAIKGVIEDGDTIIHTEMLNKNYTREPTVGDYYKIKLPKPGFYTVEESGRENQQC